jgi:hypothetical protein
MRDDLVLEKVEEEIDDHPITLGKLLDTSNYKCSELRTIILLVHKALKQVIRDDWGSKTREKSFDRVFIT